MKTGDLLRRSDGKWFTARHVGLLQANGQVCHVIDAPDGSEDQVEALSSSTEGDVYISALHDSQIYVLSAQRDTLPPPPPTMSEMRMQAVAEETIQAYINATVCAGCQTALWHTQTCSVCEEE